MVEFCRLLNKLVFTCYCSEGDSLSYDLGMKFSSKDQDNDASDNHHCAVLRKGAWWYSNYYGKANLNGEYLKSGNWKISGIIWHTFRGPFYSLKKVEMKLRPYE